MKWDYYEYYDLLRALELMQNIIFKRDRPNLSQKPI